MSWFLVLGLHSLVRLTELRLKCSKLQFLIFVNNSFWPSTHWNWKMFVKYKVVDLWIRFPTPLTFPSSDVAFERYGCFTMTRSLDNVHKFEFFMSWANFYTDLILDSDIEHYNPETCFDTWICHHKNKTSHISF